MRTKINILSVIFLATCIEGEAPAIQADQKFFDVNQIVVKGIFFVPQDGSKPTIEDISALKRHIYWARARYRVMLKGKDTFGISQEAIETYYSPHPLDYFRKKPENAAPWYLDELFKYYCYDRNTCPYIYVIVVANEKDNFPVGGGRNFNGGLNQGGGLVVLSLYLLRNSPIFQSILRHELGHSFGLVHVEEYGYDMESSNSIMSYNEKHYTRYFKESYTPGALIPEDIRSLAKNKRVFPKLTFNENKDIPHGYEISKKTVGLAALKLPEEEK